MKKRVVFSTFALLGAFVLTFTAIFAWFAVYSAKVKMKDSKEQIKVTVAVQDETEESGWQPYDQFKEKGLEIGFVETASLQKTYKVTLENVGIGPCEVTFSFGNMTDYLFNEDLIGYYKVNNALPDFDDKVFKQNTYSLYDALNYDAVNGHNGNTSRLIYTLQNLTVTQNGTLVTDAAQLPQGTSCNLWKVSECEPVFQTTMQVEDRAEITFTISYTANTSDYEEYAETVQNNKAYIERVMKQFDLTEEQAKAYFAALTQKERELLLSDREMACLFIPQIQTKQLPREELS